MRIRLEPFVDDKGATFWSAQRVDDNGTSLDNYDGRGVTEAVAIANLRLLWTADMANKALEAAQEKKEGDLKAKTYFLEVKW